MAQTSGNQRRQRGGRGRRPVPRRPRTGEAASRHVAVLTVLTLVVLGGCGRKGPPKRTRPAPPEPIVLAAPGSAVAIITDGAWLEELPAPQRPPEKGAGVWAAVPEVSSEMATMGVYTVEGTNAAGVDLVDQLGQRRRGVPQALVHELGSSRGLDAGSIALCHSWTTSAMLARVLKVKGSHVLVQYDWSGTTKQAVVEHAEPARTGVEPLAFVGYPKFGQTSKGLIVALDGERGWVLTGSGHVEVHRRAALTPIAIQSRPYRVGDAVHAYSWTGGYEPGTIKEVLEPRVRYTVDLEGDRAPRAYFFADLVPASRAP